MVIRTTNRVGLGEGDRMAIDNELIDKLLKDYKKPEDLVGENGLLKELTKRLLERAMSAEMTEHVGYEKHDATGDNTGNSRNGTSAKTIKGSSVSYTHLRAHETGRNLVCRLLLEKK